MSTGLEDLRSCMPQDTNEQKSLKSQVAQDKHERVFQYWYDLFFASKTNTQHPVHMS